MMIVSQTWLLHGIAIVAAGGAASASLSIYLHGDMAPEKWMQFYSFSTENWKTGKWLKLWLRRRKISESELAVRFVHVALLQRLSWPLDWDYNNCQLILTITPRTLLKCMWVLFNTQLTAILLFLFFFWVSFQFSHFVVLFYFLFSITRFVPARVTWQLFRLLINYISYDCVPPISLLFLSLRIRTQFAI